MSDSIQTKKQFGSVIALAIANLLGHNTAAVAQSANGRLDGKAGTFNFEPSIFGTTGGSSISYCSAAYEPSPSVWGSGPMAGQGGVGGVRSDPRVVACVASAGDPAGTSFACTATGTDEPAIFTACTAMEEPGAAAAQMQDPWGTDSIMKKMAAGQAEPNPSWEDRLSCSRSAGMDDEGNAAGSGAAGSSMQDRLSCSRSAGMDDSDPFGTAAMIKDYNNGAITPTPSQDWSNLGSGAVACVATYEPEQNTAGDSKIFACTAENLPSGPEKAFACTASASDYDSPAGITACAATISDADSTDIGTFTPTSTDG